MERNALQKLTDWKNDRNRKPLIVWGARQVGKTYLVKDLFAEKYFRDSYIYIDCKIEDEVREFCSETANAGKIIEYLSLLKGKRIDENTLLIFDEVITGFRLAFGGAAEYFGVTPDLVTYGKIIGAGMPVGAYGGRREIMELVSPVGKVYQAGTLSGNPIAMAAGLTQLKYLYEHQEIYKDLEEKGKRLYGGMEKILAEKNLPYHINHVSSLGSLFFTEQEVVDYTSAKSSDTKAFSEYFKGMLAQGIHMAPSQFEAMFLSVAHTDEIIDQTLEAVRNYFA